MTATSGRPGTGAAGRRRPADPYGDGPPDRRTPHILVVTVNPVKNNGLRTFLSVLAGLAVIFFGTSEGQGVSTAILVLAAVAGLIVWHLTKPGNTSTS